jgi:hypothetical protein
MEIWKDIENYHGLYKVSNLGRVKSFKKGKGFILKACIIPRGYLILNLYNNKKMNAFYLHRLVAKAFIPNPENKPEVNHINGIKTDNNLKNLEWCTRSENAKHAYRMASKNGKKFGRIKLTDWQVKKIRESYKKNIANISEIARVFEVSHCCISNIVHYKKRIC